MPHGVFTRPVTNTSTNCGLKFDCPALSSCSRRTTGLLPIFKVPSNSRSFVTHPTVINDMKFKLVFMRPPQDLSSFADDLHLGQVRKEYLEHYE